MRTALYTRVSHEYQVSEGFSLDAQLDRLRSYCDSQGWQVVGIYTDEGMSAKNTERPQLQRMMSDIEAGLVDVVLVYKLDRLTRNVTDLYNLIQRFEKYRVGFKSATEVFDTTTAMGRLFITIVAALAQWERENLAERTRMGQVEMTKQGKWSGGRVAFGYDYADGKLAINEPQAEIVREIFERYAGGNGTAAILSWLNNPAAPQLAPNKRWTQFSLKYILRNPLYAGFVRYGFRNIKGRRQPDEIVEKGIHEAIIDEQLFERTQQTRKARSKMPSRTSTGTYALSGILFCGKCGYAMNGLTNYRTNKETSPPRRYYACTERQHSRLCNMPRILESNIESLLLKSLEQYQQELEQKLQPADSSKLIKGIEAEKEKLKRRRKRYLELYGDEDISAEALREQLRDLDEQEAALDRSLNQTQEQVSIESLVDTLKMLPRIWDVLDVSDKRQSIRMLVKKVTVFPDQTMQIEYWN